MRLLITGAGGLLGTNLASEARHRHDVTAVWRSRPFKMDGVQAIEGDLLQHSLAEGLVRAAAPDVVVHCAAKTDVDGCERDPSAAERDNVEATRAIADATAAAGVRFVYISTDQVFGDLGAPHDETSTPAPLNVYARTKLEGERLAARVADSLVVRTNIFGWSPRRSSLPEWILGRLERCEQVPGFADVRFNPIHAGDLADLILRALEVRLTGILHLAGGQACSKYDFALALAHAFRHDPSLVQPASIDVASLVARRPKDMRLDSRRAARALRVDLPDVRSGVERLRREREDGTQAFIRGSGAI